jgi:hypothetical protein
MLNLLMVAVLEVQFCLFVLVAIAMASIALVDEAAVQVSERGERAIRIGNR